jgi:ribosomal protein S18 acetylase RimI-like enzyme
VVITLFCNEDISEFLSLAADEGWISEAWELDFLRKTFPSGCMVCRNKGIPVAFLTSIKYCRSGWIGNLLVRREWRGKGLGTSLLQRALELLEEAGTQTVWLTASESGRPIYERRGFRAIDTINRWESSGRIVHESDDSTFANIIEMDEAGWGDWREALLRATVKRGSVSLLPDAFLVHQRCENAVQIGPWGSRDPEAAASLLEKGFIPAENGQRIFLDVPSANRHASQLLRKSGFTIQSSTTLLYRGEKPAYAPGRIYALASMGSMG